MPAAVWLVAGLGVVVGATADTAPLGGGAADAVLSGAIAGLVVLLAAHASWPTLFLGGAVVAAGSTSLPARASGLAVVVAVVLLERRGRVEPSAGAVVALVVVVGALRFPTDGAFGASAGLAVLAVGPMAVVGGRRLPPLVRRPVVRLLAAGGLIVVVGVSVVGVAALRARDGLEAAQAEARAGVEAAQQGDADTAAASFRAAAAHFAAVESATGSWWATPARIVPVAAQHLRSLDRLASTGGDGAALALAGATDADVAALRLVDGRIDPAAVEAARPAFRRLASDAAAVRARADTISSPWLVGPLQDRVADFDRTVAKAEASARTAVQAADVAPWLLGIDGRRTYLLAFVTPAEARASGGFPGNYGVLTVEGGRLDLVRVGRDDELDAAGDPATRTLDAPADYVAGYERFDPARTWANTTMSPDFPSVAQAMAGLYPQAGGVPVDGVLRIDPVALAGLLELTGPVTVAGLPEPLDADNAVSFLLADQYALFDDQTQRTDLLGAVAEATFERLTSGPGAPPARFGAALAPALAGGDLALWFRDPAAQALAAHLGADAALPEPGGDLFGVTTQNASGNKIETFLQRTIAYRVRVDPTRGWAETDVTITLRNDAPPGGFPDYVIGNLVGLPPGTNRSYVSFFSTQAITSADVDGWPLALHAGTEGGFAVSSAFLDLAPQSSRTIHLTLGGPMPLPGGRYRFDHLPQVMVRPDRVSWELAATGGGRVADASTTRGTVRVDGDRVRSDRAASVGPWSVEVDLEP